MQSSSSAAGAAEPGARVAAVAARHERALLRVARQASLCHDDALDAYQRALEIFVRRVETVDPATELGWLKVVVRHEALAIRRARSESVTGEELDLDAFVPSAERTVEEQIASGERVRRSAEALRALKPDEARALMMKAHGLSYEEIGERNGWSYTKVNRAITEGRRRFMRAYAELESGEGCARFSGVLEALADGRASSAQIVEIRPHLRHCTACRATVRDLHLARGRRALAFSPLLVWLEPLRALFGRATPPVEPTIAAPSPTDLGLQVPRETPLDPVSRAEAIKQDLAGLMHRTNPSDVATGIHIASASGGGRIGALAAVIGLCVSSLGAGTMCVVTGVLPGPLGILREDSPRPRAEPPRRRASKPAARVEPPPVRVAARPTPTATPEPRRERPRRPSPSRDPSQGTRPTSHESPPITPAPATAASEPFTPEVPASPPSPAPAPATGGTEFSP